MRQERIIQASYIRCFRQHEIGRELKTMSQWLDGHRELLGLVAAICAGMASRRRAGMACRRKRCCAARFSSSTGS